MGSAICGCEQCREYESAKFMTEMLGKPAGRLIPVPKGMSILHFAEVLRRPPYEPKPDEWVGGA